MKASTLRDLTIDELKNKLKDLEKDLFDFRIKLNRKLLDNPMKIRNTRKDIAKIKTILSLSEGKPNRVLARIKTMIGEKKNEKK